MDERTARLLVVGGTALCVGLAWYRWKGGQASSVVPTVVGATLLGGVLYLLAGVAPTIAAALAGLMIADVLVLGAGGGESLIAGLATAATSK